MDTDKNHRAPPCGTSVIEFGCGVWLDCSNWGWGWRRKIWWSWLVPRVSNSWLIRRLPWFLRLFVTCLLQVPFYIFSPNFNLRGTRWFWFFWYSWNPNFELKTFTLNFILSGKIRGWFYASGLIITSGILVLPVGYEIFSLPVYFINFGFIGNWMLWLRFEWNTFLLCILLCTFRDL